MLKKLVLGFLTIVGLLFIFLNRGEILHVYASMKNADPKWFLVALLVQLLGFLFVFLNHQAALRAVEIRRTVTEIAPLWLVALAINSTTPTAGTTGTIIFADDSAKRGDSPLKTASGILLAIFTDFGSFSIILVFSIIYLTLTESFNLAEFLATVLFGFIMFFFSALFYFANRSPEKLENFLSKLNFLFFKIKQIIWEKPNRGNWPKEVTNELKTATSSMKKHPKDIALAVFFSFFNYIICIFCLSLVLKSFGITVHPGLVVTSFAISNLFRVASPSPEGIGFAEGGLALTLIAFGVHPVLATSVSLVFRGINFWIPFFAGFILLNRRHLVSSDA